MQEIFACLSPESRLFFQYTCEQNQAQFENKQQDARKVIMIELICFGIVIFFIYFVKYRTHLLAKRYVKNHVQAMDYTMFFPITNKQL